MKVCTILLGLFGVWMLADTGETMFSSFFSVSSEGRESRLPVEVSKKPVQFPGDFLSGSILEPAEGVAHEFENGPHVPVTSVLQDLYSNHEAPESLFPSDSTTSVSTCDWDIRSDIQSSQVDCFGTPPFAFCRLRNVFFYERTFIYIAANAQTNETL
jgi:hypothetical protein